MARGLLYAYAADYAAGDRQLRALRDWAAAHTHTVVSEVVSYRGPGRAPDRPRPGDR
nr:hypothetical protein GCM10020241_48080 [Streptoalloteichus tenebrarius]